MVRSLCPDFYHTLYSTTTTNNNTTLHLFNGLFSRTTCVIQSQKGKTSVDLNEARDNEVLGRALTFQFWQKKFRFDSILATESIFSIWFDSPVWYICRFYTDIQIVMMVSLVKGSAASLYAVVHSVPYQYQLDNFQQVKKV